LARKGISGLPAALNPKLNEKECKLTAPLPGAHSANCRTTGAIRAASASFSAAGSPETT
jgi:hypothetical protein